jgi:crotonobetainyl-CoA:carnitine CoA-transferase CaiB-like acyl-CoA transferase
LHGLTIVDLTRVLAGPFCTTLLADMGADVVKVDQPGVGDEARAWGPFVGDGWSAYFLGVNRGKRSIALDLKTDAGKAALGRLLDRADVFLHNLKPGSLAALGFGFDEVHARTPRLIYCSISGYGATGPRRHLTGYDPIVQAESGFMDITGAADGPPMRTGIAMTDYLAALYAFGGIMLALRDRDRTGIGQHVDIALYDAILSTLSMPAGILQATGLTPKRMGNDHAAIAPYEAVQARDGLIMIAAGNERLWMQLCEGLGAKGLIADPRFRTNADRVRNRPALKAELERITTERTVEALVTVLHEAGVPCGRVRTVQEALQDPQVEARQMMLDLGDPAFGSMRVIGNPMKLSRHRQAAIRRPPRLGEHTEEILAELGYSLDDIERLTAPPRRADPDASVDR